MNSRQKEVLAESLKDEEKVLKKLFDIYIQSEKEISEQIQELKEGIENLEELAKLPISEEEKEILLSQRQSKVYQKRYQESLKKQLSGILDDMHKAGYRTISEYLNGCYENGFIGVMYDLQGQGIPMCFPIDQNAMIKAVQLDSKISEGLYTHLGENVTELKRKISSEISRGIATGMSFQRIAKQISLKMTGTYENPKGSYAYARRIAATEGHRIQVQSAMDACYKAREKGADVLKQWDSTLDDSTRESHQKVDGEIRELTEKFSNGLMFPGDPSGGAKEVIQCRCALLQRARWALDEDELETLKKRAEYFGLDKTDNFEDYKKKYLKAAESVDKSEKGNVKKLSDNTFIPAKSIEEAEAYAKSIGVRHVDFSNISSIQELSKELKKITGKSINLEGADLELMKRNMEQLVNLGNKYGYNFNAIETTTARKYLGDVTRSGRYGDNITINYPKKYYKNRETLLAELRKNVQDGAMPPINGRNIDIYTTTHEFAHTLSEELTSRLYGRDINFWDEIEDIYFDYKKNGNGILGKYASANQNEFLAEAFANAKLHPRPTEWSEKTLAVIDKYFKKSLDKVNESGIIKTEIEKGNIKLEINHEKQARHIKGDEYKEGKSYLTISEKEAQEIINVKSGTGIPVFDRNGKWKNKELVDCGIEIGVDVDGKTQKETPTDKATIHYSKTGTHLVPRKEEKHD